MNFQKLKSWNLWIMIAGDGALVTLSYLCAYLMRFDMLIPDPYFHFFLISVPWIVPLKLLGFHFFDLYRGMWRYTSIYDLINILKACVITSAAMVLIILMTYHFVGVPRSVFVINLVLTFLFISGFRVGIRFIHARTNANRGFRLIQKGLPNPRRLLIIGAGSAGEKLLREIMENPKLNYDVLGMIDDNPKKLGDTLHRIPIIGNVTDLQKIVPAYKVDEIIIAVPAASAAQMRDIVGSCKSTGVLFKTLPGIGDIVEGKVTASAIREVRYEDLLGRPPVKLKTDQIGEYLTGKRILVTGASGSIGSELCRQIANFKPEKLILVERNESGLYDIDLELRAEYPGLAVVAVLGAIQNRQIMGQVFDEQQPHAVFHAAAYKHVPMMESHPWEAVFNNVMGTKNIIDHCSRTNVDKCVIISSDKAVRPTNVMGATKRVIEKLAQGQTGKSRCRFMAVRFGNVLGSSGSVLPLFMRQIAAGGPVTVTHPEVTRYFMTIPEACSLVLQAGAIGIGSEIFVLKMGTPTQIGTMARDLITLSGFTPDVDIMVQYTGLRPGEKLYEELITEGEDIIKTTHEDIMVLRANDALPSEMMTQHLDALVQYAENRDGTGIRQKLSEVVPDYHPQYPKA